MSGPITKEPTKKTFHFPKSAKRLKTDVGTQVIVAEASAASEPATTKKMSRAKDASASKVAKVSTPVEAKPKRLKKDKVVRDSFTMPKSDYEKIAALKRKCLDAGVSVKKSELLRAGLHMLEVAAEKRFLAAVTAVEAVKTGRPAKA